MKLFAHRGYSAKYPENTILAFQKAIECGAYGIELDTHFTADEKIIVHHYYALGQTDNGKGLISDKTVAYLQSLDAGSWFNPEFAGMKMPLLEEVFKTFGANTNYEVELKAYGKSYVDTIIKIIQNFDLLSNITFTSYQYPLITYLKKQLPKAYIAFITPPIPAWMTVETARNVIRAHLVLGELDSIHAPLAIYDDAFVQELKSQGVSPHFGLSDSPEELKKAQLLGADGITTNDITLAIRTLKDVS